MNDPDVARLRAMAEAREADGDPRLAMLYRDAAEALDRIVDRRMQRQAPHLRSVPPPEALPPFRPKSRAR